MLKPENPLTSPDRTSRALQTDAAPKGLPLDDSVAYKITVIADLVARRVSQIAAQVGGLNLSQWRVLAAIGDQDGRTASQVVEMTPMDKGIVSRAVATLVTQGYLVRRASDQDGRVSHLFMTPPGRETFQRIVAELERTRATGESVLEPAARDVFLENLNQIIAALPR